MKNSVRYSKVQCTSGKAGQGGKLKYIQKEVYSSSNQPVGLMLC